MKRFLFILLALAFAPQAIAQQTIFNVPSADVLNRGQVYGELDLNFHPSPWAFAAEPRIVFGDGHNIELGLNFPGLSTPQPSNFTLSPAVKWRPYDNPQNGWAFFLGDNLFFPAQRQSYTAGNYAYASAAKTLRKTTRFGFGVYDFSAHVADRGNRAGAQLSLEQPLSKKLKFAADWLSGATNYLTPGAVVQATKKLSIYAAYQRGITYGNHGFEFELGWNFN